MRRARTLMVLASIMATAGCLGASDTSDAPPSGTGAPGEDAEEGAGWSRMSDAPFPRAEAAVALLDGRAYLIGGLYAQSTVDLYDIADDAWSSIAAPPVPGLHHPGAVAFEGAVYSIGGYASAAFSPVAAGPIGAGWRPIDAIFRYDPDAAAWMPAGTLPEARGAIAVARSDGIVYVSGGVGPDGATKTQLWAWDVANDTWHERAPMPTVREHHALVALDGALYAVAGRDQGAGDHVTMARYDPAADTWTAVAQNPLPRGGAPTTVHDGRIVVIGGEHFGDPYQVWTNVSAYDPATDAWTEWPAHPVATHGGNAVSSDGALYTLVGIVSDDATTWNQVWRYA